MKDKRKEEYERKLSELRRKRDFHQKNVDAFQKEMNELTAGEDEIKDLVGKYIFMRNTYFKVEEYQKVSRGCHLRGRGFRIWGGASIPRVDSIDCLPIFWGDENDYEIITQNIYNSMIQNAADTVYNSIINLKIK